MNSNATERLKKLCSALYGLTDKQLRAIEEIVEQFSSPYINLSCLHNSDLIDDCILNDFGDTLRIHHCFSKEPFSKDKFEYALEKTMNYCDRAASLAKRGNPGHDIIIDGLKFSLKTQADRQIKDDKLHISKFMELGRGEWTDSVKDLDGLRTQYFAHMQLYDRILSLRCLSKYPENWRYELVEIPKMLLLEAKQGNLRIMENSSQIPKPGYCDVFSDIEELKFQLYFDGGTERKLQIRNLQKAYCIVHATWEFSIMQI